VVEVPIVVTWTQPNRLERRHRFRGAPPEGWFEAGASEHDGDDMEMVAPIPVECPECKLGGIFYEPESWEEGPPYSPLFDCPRCRGVVNPYEDAVT
jgi:hypothetical protein